ncbi:MAG: adenosylcobinamide-GDP ribazoletransferase [Brotaphodocola sp.]
MKLIRPLMIAISIYSRIPVPQFQWNEEDMRYMMCFFPWIGAIIGILLYGWSRAAAFLGIGIFGYTLIGAAIPLGITGGFHVDGFMDTMDAFHSWQPKEKKLEILKDSHIGAFSVIMLAFYGMIYLAAFSEIKDRNVLKIVCAGFFLARILSGIGVVSFPCAKHDGLLYTFADSAQKRNVRIALYVQGILAVLFMMMQDLISGICIASAAFGTFGYYYRRCKKELGGITGDTAGYFVLVCEEAMVVMAAAVNVIGWMK